MVGRSLKNISAKSFARSSVLDEMGTDHDMRHFSSINIKAVMTGRKRQPLYVGCMNFEFKCKALSLSNTDYSTACFGLYGQTDIHEGDIIPLLFPIGRKVC